MSESNELAVVSLSQPCRTDRELWRWVKDHCGLHVPTRAICPGHDAPMEYLKAAYFEPARDLVVWAPRGGGKTRLGAVATLLDLLHKPGVSVRILGGSLEQSLRMWEHLREDVERLEPAGELKGRSIKLESGSVAGVMAQSEKAVRGLRIQKLRCDEVDLFDRDIWEAAQLVTRSIETRADGFDPDGAPVGGGLPVAGTVEAISTMNRMGGLMDTVVERAKARGGRVIKWCILDVLEKCEPDRPCATCPLWDECQGRAKHSEGFFRIDDAITMKRRVSVEMWETEMLCHRPSTRGCVFPSFHMDVHVREDLTGITDARSDGGRELSLAMDFGFHNAFVCLWIETRGAITYVIDEYVQEGRTLDEHLDVIEARQWGRVGLVRCDPAGRGRNDQTARSYIDLLRSRNYKVRSRGSQIVGGLEMIRARLRAGDGAVKLFVHPRCPRLIAALRSYRYPDSGGELPLKDGTHDHPIDALRYHFVNAAPKTVQGGKEY